MKMKKLLILPLLAVLALFASCSDDNGPDLPETMNEVFFGKLLYNGAAIADDAKCGLDIVGEDAVVTLFGVTFAPAMPAMDIVIPGLKCKKSGDNYIISGKDVVPTVMGAPVDRYTMSSVEGLLSGDKFVVNTVTAMGTIGFSNAMIEIAPEDGAERSYKGNIVSGDFAKEIVVCVTMDKASSTLDVVLNKVKFAANMPLELDITLKEIPYTVNDGVVEFSATDIAPYMNTESEPAPAYMFATAGGCIAGDKLVFDAAMSDSLASYVAGRKFAFEGTEVVE